MKKIGQQIISFVIILSFLFGITITSCETAPEAMDLPDEETMILDLSIFPTSNTKSVELAKGNWFYSWLNVIGWNALAVGQIVIPTTAYLAALDQTPIYLGDNSWKWSYSVPVAGDTYVAELIGTRTSNVEFTMDMSLSKTTGADQFEDFDWFSGVVRFDHTAATWKFSYDPLNQTEYLEVAYTNDFEKGESKIRYTVTDPANPIYDSYIEYGVRPDSAFDAYFTIDKNDTLTFIEWDTEFKNGRVMDELFFTDSTWHCWDSQLEDSDCTSSMK